MNLMQKILVLICSAILITVLGCSAWMDGLTPAYIDPVAIEYADANSTVFTPYTSLWDARRIKRELDFKHATNQQALFRTIEDDKTRYAFLNEAMQINISSAEELRDTLFSPTGPVSLLFAAVPGLALGAYLIPRPTDRKRIAELENGKA